MEVMNINEGNFHKEVLEAEQPVLVDIWAPWCGPCRMMGPIVEQVASENNHFKVAKINADEAPDIAQRYNVASIPTLLVFKGGELVNRSVGVISKADILKLVEA